MQRRTANNPTRTPRHRLSLMVLAWLVLCALLSGGLPAGTAHAQSQGGATDIQLDLSAGYGDTGAYLIGEWMPVRVTLTNPPGGAARRVRVEVGVWPEQHDPCRRMSAPGGQARAPVGATVPPVHQQQVDRCGRRKLIHAVDAEYFGSAA